jgi:hypothetical protein
MLEKYFLSMDSMQYSPHISEDLGRESHIWIMIKADGLSIPWCPQISEGLQSLARAYSITHYFTSILIICSMFVIDCF